MIPVMASHVLPRGAASSSSKTLSRRATCSSVSASCFLNAALSSSEAAASTDLDSRNTSARQPGRGRHAETPWQIPWKGWKDIFWRTYEQIGENRLLAVAAGVVFYGLLAVFPAVTAFKSLYRLFASAWAIGFPPLPIKFNVLHRRAFLVLASNGNFHFEIPRETGSQEIN
jgi:hypothetical protein